ncbi:AMP-binding enzyme, putative [Coccidioides posadasii C735 delta SOWgp]|uniref:AMP-binding enzyme, putative n=1 Tax=Coccidioides posadasii (strain C735) TaxID=222929 RepID=C5P7D8_COCP7|nr:AMP-binding enzyme, putative [Coccidioides posadasii C735 delta SOWgp]EER27338.1 AMP-binding enzyme, putative [Coccidioides posadasii C735 delta SOWgp]|eukprot:XP_003069483.1 AMP-binding enzyme, putative [Coccidioides posadasii C735 delta SOWgp]
MVFRAPAWVGELPPIPDDVAICDFMLDDKYGRYPLASSKDPFTCGMTGRTYSAAKVAERVDVLARALAKEFGWHPNKGTEWEKVVGIYSFNTIDFLVLCWAIHRCGGIASPANAVYSGPELTYQLKDSGAQSLFTCLPSLPIALEAAAQAGIPRNRIYILDLPTEFTGSTEAPQGMRTLEQFITEGYSLPKLEKLNFGPGQGARQTAFLCYSSGTSGLPKGVKIAHRNVIANTLQMMVYEAPHRNSLKPAGQGAFNDVALGLLPQSHIYSLVVMCHCGPYRGDQVIVLPKFELNHYLQTVEKYKIGTLYLVPPIIIAMLRNKELCDKRDLSAVRAIFTGAAPLGKETADELQQWKPSWLIKQGYGMTETCTVVCTTSSHDVWLGSSGSILPGIECKIISPEGVELTGYDEPGELVVKSPSVVLGYLNNEKATEETFIDGWMRTGDEAVVRVAPSGNEHIFIVDRIKELIKVKGLQVAPAELEAHILSHPNVADCAVIPVPDDSAGELPKAFVVKSSSAGSDDTATIRAIMKHVEDHKARHKWLKGGVEFLDVIPKSPSGKILRRLLRDKEREARRKAGAKI